jgi:urease subunit gamma
VFLTPHEQDRLLIHVAADVARRRRDRGLRLNHLETVAVLTAFLLEEARDGRTVVDLMQAGREVLTRDDVLEGIPEMVKEVQVEATFEDGTKLVTLRAGTDPATAGRPHRLPQARLDLSSLATVGGAIGSGLEDEETVRAAAYGYHPEPGGGPDEEDR